MRRLSQKEFFSKRRISLVLETGSAETYLKKKGPGGLSQKGLLSRGRVQKGIESVFSRIAAGTLRNAAGLSAILCFIATESRAAEATATTAASASVEANPETTPPAEGAEPAPLEAPIATPPAPEPAKPEPPKPPLVQIYGIIKPEIIAAQGAETFGKVLLTAPTAASNPIANPNYGQTGLSFQLQQTRFGLKVNEGGLIQGRIEVDFIDPGFSYSSPIQGTGVRLRLAYMTYKPVPHHTITIGQNWDIFSPLNVLTMNMVGNSYQSGNSAFLRPQVAYTYGSGQGLEISAALGLRAQNTTGAMNLLEYGMIPTFALQVGFRKDKNWYGVSGIVGAEETQLDPRSYNGAFAGNLFANLALTDSFTLILDAYIGKATNSLGLLVLGTGPNVVDAGGYVSGNLKFAKAHALWVTAGASGVLNAAELPLGYTPADPVTGAAAARVGIGGIESNINLRATYVLTPLDGLQFYLEPFMFITKHKIAAADDPSGTLGNRVAPGIQIGSRYTF